MIVHVHEEVTNILVLEEIEVWVEQDQNIKVNHPDIQRALTDLDTARHREIKLDINDPDLETEEVPGQIPDHIEIEIKNLVNIKTGQVHTLRLLVVVVRLVVKKIQNQEIKVTK